MANIVHFRRHSHIFMHIQLSIIYTLIKYRHQVSYQLCVRQCFCVQWSTIFLLYLDSRCSGVHLLLVHLRFRASCGSANNPLHIGGSLRDRQQIDFEAASRLEMQKTQLSRERCTLFPILPVSDMTGVDNICLWKSQAVLQFTTTRFFVKEMCYFILKG